MDSFPKTKKNVFADYKVHLLDKLFLAFSPKMYTVSQATDLDNSSCDKIQKEN